MKINKMMELVHDELPGGIGEVWDFEKECPKVGMVQDPLAICVVRIATAAMQEEKTDLQQLIHVAAALEGASCMLGRVVDGLIRLARE